MSPSSACPCCSPGPDCPPLPGLAGEARSYAERLFSFVDIGSSSPADATTALVQPAEAEGAAWSPAAVDRVIADTQGYPFFLQEFGKQAWNVAEGPRSSWDVAAAAMLALDDLDRGFFRAGSTRRAMRNATT